MKHLLLALLFLCFLAINAKQHAFLTQHILKYEDVHQDNIQLVDTSLPSFKRSGEDHETISLTFRAYGQQFDLNMERNHDLFSDTSVVNVYGAEDNLIKSYKPPKVAYKEKRGASMSRVTIFDYSSLQVKGTWRTGEETYYIDPVDQHRETMKRDVPLTVTHVIYRQSDMIFNKDLIFGKKNTTSAGTVSKRNTLQTTTAAQSKSPPPSPCPTTVKEFLQSVVTDNVYTTKVGGEDKARTELTNNWNIISQRYESTLNIRIKVDVIDIRTAASTTPEWNSAACPDIETKLSQFSKWRGTQNTNAGLWHLLTNCYPPPGTVGLAWLGVTCMSKAYAQGTEYFSGAGVSNYLTGADGYRVAAHETGHNFNADHDTGGIMYYSVTNVDYFSATSQNAMCAHVQSTTSKCYKDPTTTCTPNCAGKNCGANGCGGTCGTCTSPNTCDTTKGTCQAPACTPNCAGKNCGSDGCGGSCGTCTSGNVCQSGTCVVNATELSLLKAAVLDIHSSLRSAVGSPTITWDENLANIARTWTGQCQNSINPQVVSLNLGENRASGDSTLTTQQLLNAWASEKPNFDCSQNKCTIGACNEYLQMVADKAISIGCGLTVCTNSRTGTLSGAYSYPDAPYYPGGSGYPDAGTPMTPGGDIPPSGSSKKRQSTLPWKNLVCYYTPRVDLTKALSKCVPCAPSTSCSGQGRQCGYIDNGCTSEYCGDCPVGAKCGTDGLCGCVPFTTCAASDKSCGTIFDGCNNINCGNCSGASTCSNGQCVCSPTSSCASNGFNCGSFNNGCSNENCGTCGSSKVCDNNVCVEPASCVPSVSCASSSYQCGALNDGCNNILDCGICFNANENCVNGKCVCTPTSQCPTTPKPCGTINNGCGLQECGRCTGANEQCINFTCTSCFNCHTMASCVNDACTCLPGYVGDGVSCVAMPTNVVPKWSVIEGLTNWRVNYNSLDGSSDVTNLDGNSPTSVIWENTDNLALNANLTYIVDVTPLSGAKDWGLIWRVTKSGSYYKYLKFGYKGYYYVTLKNGNSYSEYSISGVPAGWSAGTKKTMAIVSDGKNHRLFINNANAIGSGYYLQVTGYDTGYVGLFATGPCNFQNPLLQTKTTMTVTLSSCMTVDEYKRSLKQTLGLDEFQIENVIYNINCGTTKRFLSGGGGTVTFTLVGSPSTSSNALASQLAAKIASSHPSIMENFAGAISQPIIHSTTPLASQVFALTGVVASTLPVAIIAGSVAGAVALAGIGTGVYFALKKKKDNKPKEEKKPEPIVTIPEPIKEDEPKPIVNEEPKPYKPKGATVNIFNLDPNDPRSITARNPNINQY